MRLRFLRIFLCVALAFVSIVGKADETVTVDVTRSWLPAASMEDAGLWALNNMWQMNAAYPDEAGGVGLTAPFLEAWVTAPWTLGDVRAERELTVPSGRYTLSASVMAVNQSPDEDIASEGCYLFANENTVSCSSINGVSRRYSVTTEVDGETLSIGLFTSFSTCNWVAFDNLTLTYTGSRAVLLACQRERTEEILLPLLGETETTRRIEQILSVNQTIQGQFDALEQLQREVEELGVAYEALRVSVGKATDYLEHSICDDKVTFEALVDEADKADMNMTVDQLTDLHKRLQQGLETYLLTAEPTQGTVFDVSFLMANPTLRESAEGWSMTPTQAYEEAEIYNRTFDFYQTLAGMRPGCYRLSVTGFHRNGEYKDSIETERNAGCVLYANEERVPLLTLYYTDKAALFKRAGGYANNMAEASKAFEQGFYSNNSVTFECTTDRSTVTLGLANENSRSGNWTCFRDFRLEYLGAATPGKLVGQFRIAASCQNSSGAWVPGASVGQGTPLYQVATVPDDQTGWWYVREINSRQYVLQNVATGQYITWDNRRMDGSMVRRYVDLTDEIVGDSSLWTLTLLDDNTMEIRNVHSPSHLMDLRVESNVVGTYDRSGTPNYNQRFYLYDTGGNVVTDLSVASFAKGVASLKINGRELAYDQNGSRYFCTMPRVDMETGYCTVRVNYILNKGYAGLRIDGKTMTDGKDFRLSLPGYGEELQMEVITDEGDVAVCNLVFTALPVVQIYGSFNDIYSDASIRVTDPEAMCGDTLITSRIRWRGATTRYRQKKQYAVKLFTGAGESRDVSFFGLRDDNNWILDGMVVDMARMRNRVVTDLWNDFGAKPYYYDKEPEALTGTKGRFVELLLNDRYVGLYCMTEKIDRKQMKLKKYAPTSADYKIRGELFKASEWSYSVFMGHNRDVNYYPGLSPIGYSNKSENWDSYEMKYPDIDDGEQVEWADLYNAVNFVCTADDETFSAQVGEYFDMPPLLDYYILMETILSADNHGKNMYWAVHNRNVDKKLTLALWDLDSTCGRRWDASEIDPEQDYTDYITYQEHGDFNLFRRIKACNVDNFNEEVRYRYKELRANVLSIENLMARFESYKELFDLSGASLRESKRWSYTDFNRPIDLDNEMDYLYDWFAKRLAFLDEQWDIASLPDRVPSAVENILATDLRVHIEGRTVVLTGEQSCEIAVYTLDGRLERCFQFAGGCYRLTGLASGIWLLNGHKVVVP